MQDDPHTTGADGIERDESHAPAENPTEQADASEPGVDDVERRVDDHGARADDHGARADDHEPGAANREPRADDHEPPPEDDGDGDVDDHRAELDPEPLAYRLERLRLWRTLVTLAVVVARLIRSL